MSEYRISGTIDQIHPIVERGNFKSRKLWLTTTETYPQTLEVECAGNKIDLFNGLSVGQSITIDINLRGRKWQPDGGEAKVFVTLSAWRVDAGQMTLATPTNGADDANSPLPF